MAKKGLEIPVNPKTLQWARDSLGLSIESAAKKLKIAKGLLEGWETGEEKLSYSDLKKVTNVYKRPSIVFLLDEVPVDPILPKDFRFTYDRVAQKLPEKALLEIRKAQRRHEIAVELARDVGLVPSPILQKRWSSDNPDSLASSIRREFSFDGEAYFKQFQNESDAYKLWKRRIEDCGILVFQASLGTIKQVRGLSIFYDFLPIILINTKDSQRAKLFTLVHEFCHLLLNQAGVCNVEPPEYRTEISNNIERTCNAFSAAALVPKDEFLAFVRGRRLSDALPDHELTPVANKFAVSVEVVLRRLLTLDIIDQGQYQRRREQILREYEKYHKPGFGRATWAEKIISANGFSYTDIILRSYSSDKISINDASDYLGAKIKYLGKIESEMDSLRRGLP